MPNKLSSLLSVLIAAIIFGSCGETTEFAGQDIKSTPEDLRTQTEVDNIPVKPEPAKKYNGEVETYAATPQVVGREFDVTFFGQESAVHGFSRDVKSQNVTLSQKYASDINAYTQIPRAKIEQTFNQGVSGTTATETFDQTQLGILDILVVIDNSGSMREEQNNLESKLGHLISAVANSNWKIGVITTDMRWLGTVNKGELDVDDAFKDLINLAGVYGSGNERGVNSAVVGLGRSGFIRAKSKIAVLIVSDEDNCSTGYKTGCGSRSADDPATLKAELAIDGRLVGKDSKVYGIVPGDPQCFSAWARSFEYDQLIADTGGISGVVCDASYAATLDAISLDFATILETDFPLPHPVSAGTNPSVKVNLQIWNSFTVNNNGVISFTDVPPPGASITVEYTHSATPIFKEFALDEKPDLATAKVKINGALVSQNSYNIDVVAKKLTFNNPPADSAVIKIEHLEADVVLHKDFLCPPNVVIKSGSVTAKVEGVSTPVVHNANTFSFAVAPSAGTNIVVSYMKDLGPNTVYNFATIGENPRDFKAVDQTTNKDIAVSFSSQKVSFNANEVVAGNVVKIQYRNDGSDLVEVDLPHSPIAMSIKAEAGSVSCSNGDGIEFLSETRIRVDCDFAGAAEFALSYDWEVPPKTTFTLDEVADPEVGVWTVYVNEVVTKEFTRAGKAITLKSAPPSGSVVKIIYNYFEL